MRITGAEDSGRKVAAGYVDSAPAVGNLTADMQARLTNDGQVVISKVDAQSLAGWNRGQLVFDNAPFAQVIGEVARYTPAHLYIAGKNLRSLRVSGTYHLAGRVIIFY